MGRTGRRCTRSGDRRCLLLVLRPAQYQTDRRRYAPESIRQLPRTPRAGAVRSRRRLHTGRDRRRRGKLADPDLPLSGRYRALHWSGQACLAHGTQLGRPGRARARDRLDLTRPHVGGIVRARLGRCVARTRTHARVLEALQNVVQASGWSRCAGCERESLSLRLSWAELTTGGRVPRRLWPVPWQSGHPTLATWPLIPWTVS